MSKTIEILLEIQIIVSLFFILLAIYQLFVCIIGLIRKKTSKAYKYIPHKFMAVVPAHNEEKVIGDLIDSLKKQEYDKSLLDVYVIADNCNDKTACIAREHGAIVYERFDDNRKRKGYALEWFFDRIIKEKPEEYDAFCVFDADNVVDKMFIKVMNEKLCEGERIVQGCRDIKNASDTWVTANYALFYWVMNNCYHYSRYKLGLSPLINGTGFMVDMSVLKETGWHFETITEDIEFSLMSIAKGYKIGWAKEAIVYDEQPLTFKDSCVQRLRWAVGHIQCIKGFFGELSRRKKLTPSMIDTAIYVFCMPLIILTLVNLIITATTFFLVPKTSIALNLGFKMVSLLTTIAMVLISLVTLIRDKRNLKNVWKGLLTMPIFLLSWFFINLFAFTKKNIEWKEIKHFRAFSKV